MYIVEDLLLMTIFDHSRFESTLFSLNCTQFLTDRWSLCSFSKYTPSTFFARSLLFDRSNIVKGADLKGKLCVISYLCVI